VVEVVVPIRQAFNTKDAAVHAVITGTVPNGYLLTSVNVEPTTVTLLGDRQVLDELGGFVDTVPIDVTGAAGDIVRRVPLAPPPGVSALNERGVTEGSVEVAIAITPLMGNLRLTVPIDVVGVAEDTTVSVSPPSVDVLLNGPLPLLDQVNADQRLVRVIVDASGLPPGTHQIVPRLIVPDGLEATVLPDTVEAVVVRLAPTPETESTPASSS
jgi:YbbR domain-containing protein